MSYIFFYNNNSYKELGDRNVLGQAGMPPWRANLALLYSLNKLNVSLNSRTFAEVETTDRARKIPSYTEADLQAGYSTAYGTFQAGLLNVFNTQPVYDMSLQSRIDTTLYMPLQTAFIGYQNQF